MIKKVIGLYFSPRGGTAKITEQITWEIAGKLNEKCPEDISCETYDFFDVPKEGLDFDSETVAVIGMPVIVGKLPLPALMLMKQIHGAGALSVAVVTYGTMRYGNALYELYHFSEEQEFKIIGAGAFVAKHTGLNGNDLVRPDLKDLSVIRSFSKAVANKLERLSGCEIEGLKIKPAPIGIEGCLPVHRISKYAPGAAAFAESVFETMNLMRKDPEWFL